MREHLKRFFSAMACALLLSLPLASPARAGIPVIDATNLAQNIQDVINSITQIENQIQQITQLQQQIASTTGNRGLGTVLNDPRLHYYIPANAQTILNRINTDGYAGLSGAAKAMRDARMLYNCMDRNGQDRVRCQSFFGLPYQQKAFMEGALEKSGGRLTQINQLLTQVNATNDPKSIAEVQARIQGESAMLQHELSLMQATRYAADAELATHSVQSIERRKENLRRTYRVSESY